MKRRFSRVLSLFLGSVMLTSLVGCTSTTPTSTTNSGDTSKDSTISQEANNGSSEDDKVTIKFLHKWPQPENQAYFDEIVEAYMKLNPNVTIISEGVADEPIKDKLRVMMGSNDRPDVFFSWSGEFAKKFIAADAVYDLTEAMEANNSEWQNSIMAAGLEPFSQEGKIYGVPLRINGKFFVYNKEVFEKFKLSEPTTWDEFLNLCETLKSNNITPIAFGDQYPWAACHYITGLNQKLVSQDIRMKDYEKATGEFIDMGYVQALEMFQELEVKGYFNEFSNSLSHDMAHQNFANGVAAMIYVELEEFETVNNNMEGASWGFFPMPEINGGAGNTNYLTGAPDGFMISSTTQYPEVAIDFLQFLTSIENAQRLVQVLKWPSPVIGAVNIENSPDYLVKGMDAIQEADGMALWLDTDIDSRLSDVYLPGLQEIINGSTTPEALMKKVQTKAKEIQTVKD